MYSKEITLYGVKLSVEYNIEGRYIPATRDEPEEQPTVVITKITAYDSDVDLQDLLEAHVETIYETLNELI